MSLVTSLLDQIWFQFILVGVLGYLAGLEYREYLLEKDRNLRFGTARTYGFIALLGYVFVYLDPEYHLFLGGMLALVVWSGFFYWQKLQNGQPGILGLLIALLVYTFGPVSRHLPLWFLILEFVCIVFVLNAQPLTRRLTETIDRRELMTLAKFLLLAAVILPLMPDQAVVTALPTTPFRIWVAVVAISAISYAGYILQRYVFPHRGYLLTGLLGGLYSSTATTLVLAHKTRETPGAADSLNLAIIAATGMMYLRLLLLIIILNPDFLGPTLLPFLALGLGSIGYSLIRARRDETTQPPGPETASRNPLELGTAILFAALFLLMLVLSRLVLHNFGDLGLQILSFIAGFTDIDPFVLSLLKGDFPSTELDTLAAAIIIAAGSNNLLKALYAYLAGDRQHNQGAIKGLTVLGAATLIVGVGLGL